MKDESWIIAVYMTLRGDLWVEWRISHMAISLIPRRLIWPGGEVRSRGLDF